MFCSHCGQSISDTARFCPNCGASSSGNDRSAFPTPSDAAPRSRTDEMPPVVYRSRKEKSVALLLCFFLGCWGAHKFYLGEKSSAIIMLVGGLVGLFLLVPLLATAIWSLVELIIIAVMDPETFEAKYNPIER